MIPDDYFAFIRVNDLPETTTPDTANESFSDVIGRSHRDSVAIQSPENESAKHFLEDLAIGDHWWSQSREITGDDVAEFAVLTGDDDPLHGDDLPAEPSLDSPFGEPIVHGLLGLSVMAGLSSTSPRVATLALVEVADWKFEAPVFFGDSVRVLTTVESISPHGRRAGRVVWRRELFNQKGRLVQSGRIVSLVARRKRLTRSSTDKNNTNHSARPNAPR